MQPGVYILLCSNGRYYIGSTIDINRRLSEHRFGRVKATKNLLPVTLVLFQTYETAKVARQVEFKLKKLKSRKIVERIIAEGSIKLKI